MLLQKKIYEDWKTALKNKDSAKDTLSLMITELKNKAIEINQTIDGERLVNDDVAIDVLMKMSKQRTESIESYDAAGRSDLSEKENNELSIIKRYLPKELSKEELTVIIDEALRAVGSNKKSDIGKIMPVAMKLVNKRASGKQIQEVLKDKLV